MKRALVSWSGGKDAAWSLLRSQRDFEIAALVTTVSEQDQSVPIHRIPGNAVEGQAAALGIELWKVPLPQPCANSVYKERLMPVWQRALENGIDAVIFGDLFLADIRAWREQLLEGTGLTACFPLWGEPTERLALEMIQGGLRATICAVDSAKIPRLLPGVPFDAALIANLPNGVDPCGENGEFHTFVSWMPGFRHEVPLCAESFL